MKTLFLYLVFALSASAFGSDVKHCKFIGEVISIEESQNLTVQILEANRMETSYVDCQEFVETTVHVQADEHTFSIGDMMTLEYLYTAGLTPQGIQVSESLVIIE